MLRRQLLLLCLCGVSCTAPREQGTLVLPDAGVPPSADVPFPSVDARRPEAMAPPDASTTSVGANDAPHTPAADCVANELPIAYVSDSGPPSFVEFELYLMSLDASTVLRFPSGGHIQNPVWAPDGNTIAFRRREPWADQGTSFVGVINVESKQTVALTDTDTYPYTTDAVVSPDGPSWSPDGQNIAYVSQRESNMWRIWIMSRSGAQPRLLLPDLANPQLYVSWSRHAAGVLAYVESSETGSDIWRVDLADTSLRENLSAGQVSEPTMLRWSPDGTRIAFSALDTRGADAGGGDREIFVLDIISGKIVQLTDDDFLDQHPTWSPDGRRLLYTSGRPWPGLGLRSNLWIVTLDGSEPARQITTTSRLYSPDWYGGPCATPG